MKCFLLHLNIPSCSEEIKVSVFCVFGKNLLVDKDKEGHENNLLNFVT